VRDLPHSCRSHTLSVLAGFPRLLPFCPHECTFTLRPFHGRILLFKMKQNNSCSFQVKHLFQNLVSLFLSSTLSNLISTFASLNNSRSPWTAKFCPPPLTYVVSSSPSPFPLPPSPIPPPPSPPPPSFFFSFPLSLSLPALTLGGLPLLPVSCHRASSF
jgi:hypothetical protein